MQMDVDGIGAVQHQMKRIQKQLGAGGGVLAAAMRRATLLVTRKAKTNAPVDTGRLRSSITPSVESRGKTVKGAVGSNVEYAPHVEEPGPVRRTGQRPYLQPAFTENIQKIIDIFDNAISRLIGG